jgi:hypothetical protein
MIESKKTVQKTNYVAVNVEGHGRITVKDILEFADALREAGMPLFEVVLTSRSDLGDLTILAAHFTYELDGGLGDAHGDEAISLENPDHELS